MKDALKRLGVAVALLGWVLFFAQRPSKPVIVGPTLIDTVLRVDTLRPKQPNPQLLPGRVDTVTAIDTAAVDSVRRVLGDSIRFYRYLLQAFSLTYRDSMQEMGVDVDPVRKSAIFTPRYKPIRYLATDVNSTSFVDNEQWLKMFAGVGYSFYDSGRVRFFLQADVRLQKDVYLTPELGTDRIQLQVRYKFY